MEFLLKGMGLGFAIAAPLGPINILCIRRTLQFGKVSGIVSCLGSATADFFYASIAVFGLTFLTNMLMAGQVWLQWLGGFFLLYIGIKTLFAKVMEEAIRVNRSTLLGDFTSTFFFTLACPMTILYFMGLFAAQAHHTFAEAISLIVGVFLGSSFWGLLLTGGTTLFRKRVNPKTMQHINRIAGVIIVGFGIAILLA